MIEKKIKEVDWLRQHTLTPEQVKQLIQNKLTRAVESYETMRKREILCGGR